MADSAKVALATTAGLEYWNIGLKSHDFCVGIQGFRVYFDRFTVHVPMWIKNPSFHHSIWGGAPKFILILLDMKEKRSTILYPYLVYQILIEGDLDG